MCIIDQLSNLIKEYKVSALENAAPDPSINQYNAGFISTIANLQTMDLGHRPVTSEKFFNYLNSLINDFLDQAQYRIYVNRRTPIKNWQYGEVLPLDQIDQTDLGGTLVYSRDNKERLSKLRPPQSFFEEAVYRSGKFTPFFYRYKNEIYGFQFAQCTDRPTGTWACFQAWKLKRGGVNESPQPNCIEWSEKLPIKLGEIPSEGTDISVADKVQNIKFYRLFLGGSNIKCLEDNYIYDLRITYQ